MIGGKDYIFTLPPCRIDDVTNLTLGWMKSVWPKGWGETPDMDEPAALANLPSEVWSHAGSEFFIYEDEAAAREWTESGATESGHNRMVHFLFRPTFTEDREETLEVTAVVDVITPAMKKLLGGLQEKLQSETAKLLNSKRGA